MGSLRALFIRLVDFCLFPFHLFATVVRSNRTSIQGHYKFHSTYKAIIHQLLIYRELDLWEIYDISSERGKISISFQLNSLYRNYLILHKLVILAKLPEDGIHEK